jgi:hypothetical protein
LDGGSNLIGEPTDRLVQVGLKVLDFAVAGTDFGQSGLRDAIGGLAAFVRARDQALVLQLRQAGIDRARARRIEPAESGLQILDDLVSMPWRLGKQRQQVEPQLAVRKDRAHRWSQPSGTAAAPR